MELTGSSVTASTVASCTRRKRCVSFFHGLPNRISETVESFFFRVGKNIAARPYYCLAASTTVILLCLSGLYCFRQEKDPLRLWVPADSDFVHDTHYLLTHFQAGVQTETLILTANDILEPKVLLQLQRITREAIAAKSDNTVWTDVCIKVPAIVGVPQRDQRARRGAQDDFFDSEPWFDTNGTIFEPAVYGDSKLYCSIVENFPKACLIYSILDIWDYDENKIVQQKKKDIIESLNRTTISPTLGHPMDFTELLGGVTRDTDGKIISAKSVKSFWMVQVNFTRVDSQEFGNHAGTAEWTTNDVLKWESAFLDVMRENARSLNVAGHAENGTINIYYEAGRSFGDVTESTIFQDMDKLAIGILLMFLYVSSVLSGLTCDHGDGCSWVEFRIWLTVAGLLCVGGAFVIAVGICSILGIPYGPVHTSLPFMLLGLGIDDIFIMAAAWKKLQSEEVDKKRQLPDRIGSMLAHAGSAICITSLTDVIAFVIGASTILPSLQSFCIYAAVGVAVNFLLQITYFVAFFTLDRRRIEARKNGFIPCIAHATRATGERVARNHGIVTRLTSRLYLKVILTKAGKVLVILATIVMASLAALGALHLKQWFDPHCFLPKESYLSEFNVARSLYYPEKGYDAFLLIGNVSYHSEFPKIMSLARALNHLSSVQRIRSWPVDFAEFTQTHFRTDLSTVVLERDRFHEYLSKFLFSRSGGKYQRNFQFDEDLKCGEIAPNILISTLDFTFRRFAGPEEWVPAMDQAKDLAKEADIHGFVTVWSKVFGTWVTDKLISQEVSRNLILALVSVVGMTAILIAEPQTCFWILVCVLLTLVNVCGFMHFWGLTIDIVSCIALELSIGLSIDYSAHVAHAYLNTAAVVQAGRHRCRTQRTIIALRHTGAAVAYGAGSTLLALSMMIFSDAYIFRSFFKIFFLVISFGLWHGLVFLPVILSIVGPRSVREPPTEEAAEREAAKTETGEPATDPIEPAAGAAAGGVTEHSSDSFGLLEPLRKSPV